MTLSPASLIPAGTIVPYLGGRQTNAPNGWLFCNGAYLSRSSFGDLFAAIGTTYGTTSTSNFRLPLPSTIMRGASSIGLGVTATNHSHSFAFNTSGNLSSAGSHNHSANGPSLNSYIGGHTHYRYTYNFSGANASNFSAVSGNANLLAGDSHSHEIEQTYAAANPNYSHTHGVNAGVVTGGGAHEHSYSYSVPVDGLGESSLLSSENQSLPPVVYLAYIIKT